MSYPNPIIGEENMKIDKLGNSSIDDSNEEDAGPMTRHQIRHEQRKAQLGLAASPPDRRRGPDRGLDEGWKSQGNENSTLVTPTETQDLPPQSDRQGDFTYNNSKKKTRQGWGDMIEAQTAEEEFDPNDPGAAEKQNATATSSDDVDESGFKTLDEYHPKNSLPKSLGRVPARAPNTVPIDPSQEPKHATRIHDSMDAR